MIRRNWLFLFILGTRLWAQYPLIEDLSPSDVVFKQLQEDIMAYHKAHAEKKPSPPLVLYRYVSGEADSLLSLAARVNINYDTLASLNRMENRESFKAGISVLIPNTPGLFLPEDPQNDMESLVLSWRKDLNDYMKVKVQSPQGTQDFYFLPGEHYHPTERLFFLNTMFRFPLPKGKLTSRYGPRINPVTGKSGFHNGIDLGAPEGTLVMASRAGKIRDRGWNDILGNYVIISHFGEYETIYGHLKTIFVKLNQEVSSGMILGEVGNTGLSTGPHLHFELRRRGKAEDPLPLLPKVKK